MGSVGGGEVHSSDAGGSAGTAADAHELVGVVTALTGGILFEFDREGYYLRVFTGEPELLIRPVDELVGRPISEVLGPAGDRFHETVRSVFDTEQPTAFDYTLDVPAGRRTFSCEARPHTRPGGARKTVTFLVRDITAARALEAKLLQAERLAALGLLAASVGHEIRQPLAYVSASLDLLEREVAALAVPEHAQASLANIRVGARRIAEIAASLDLLAGRPARTSTSSIDMRRPLKAALDLCASELSGIRVETALAEVPAVLGDEGELCQVFANLLLNAAQSIIPGREGAVKVTLLHAPGIAGDRVRVSVSDDGSGISPEHAERIFDPFFTTKSGQRGTGLGLFITRGIVEAHGGTVEVVSKAGHGTTLDVFLPVAPRAERTEEPITGVRPKLPSAAASGAASAPHAQFASCARLKVLLVDDEPRFLESLRLALDEAHDIQTCGKAAEALEWLAKDPDRYDVVVCDLSMQGIDGVTFYERMEALGIADRFVLMTGGAFTPRAAEFLARGTCPRISKPFLVERMLALLDRVTRGRSAS